MPTLNDIWCAAERIAPFAHKTPVLTSRSLNADSGAELYFKCENFQRIGAFKFRGACNAVFALSESDAARGVATHSSGNHAAALALAGALRGIAATVVMPESTVRVKVDSVRRLGAKIVFCADNHTARIDALNRVVAQTGATFIHPFENEQVMAGQGTAALELIREVGRIDVFIAPISGGGLLAGNAVAVSGMCPGAEIIGAEPEGADDAARSFAADRPLKNAAVNTISDGLRADIGQLNFDILRRCSVRILTVNDAETIAALRIVMERLKIVIEPSCATVLAAILKYKHHFAGRRVGVLLSGGNVDFETLRFS